MRIRLYKGIIEKKKIIQYFVFDEKGKVKIQNPTFLERLRALPICLSEEYLSGEQTLFADPEYTTVKAYKKEKKMKYNLKCAEIDEELTRKEHLQKKYY